MHDDGGGGGASARTAQPVRASLGPPPGLLQASTELGNVRPVRPYTRSIQSGHSDTGRCGSCFNFKAVSQGLKS